MRSDSLERDFPYLALRGDGNGSFASWLEVLGVQFPSGVRVQDFVRWGWLIPTRRVVVPDQYFLLWEEFPSLGGDHPVAEEETWADHLWYAAGNFRGSIFSFAGPLEGLWFVHPFDRDENPYRKHFVDQTAPFPEARDHPNGGRFFPWIEYFPYWRGYQLLELLETTVRTLFIGGDREETAARVAANIPTLAKRDDAARRCIAARWDGRERIFSLLGAYRSMRASLAEVKQLNHRVPVTSWSVEEAARALAGHLSLSVEGLATLVESELLVMAREWYGRPSKEEDAPVVGRRAWGQLQKDILCAVEWLCILSGKEGDQWFDRWSSTGLGARRWLPLVDALPYEPFRSETYFVKHYGNVRGAYELLHGSARLPTNSLLTLSRWVRSKTWVFGAWMRLYRRLHEGLRGAPDWDWAGIELPDVVEEMVVFCLTSEKVLADLWLLLHDPTSSAPDVKPLLRDLSHTLEGVDERFVGAWSLADSQWEQLTKLRDRPANAFDRVLNEPLGEGPAPGMARALLGFGVARNYSAHHTYLDGRLVRTPEGGLFVGAVATTVLYLADGVRRSIAARSR